MLQSPEYVTISKFLRRAEIYIQFAKIFFHAFISQPIKRIRN